MRRRLFICLSAVRDFSSSTSDFGLWIVIQARTQPHRLKFVLRRVPSVIGFALSYSEWWK